MAATESAAPVANSHLDMIRRQFSRQAEAYEAMPIVTDPEFLSYIVSVSGVSKDDHVLDVASGPGFVAMAFAPHCASVTGIDATDRFVERATGEGLRRHLDNVRFTVGDAERMDFADDAFAIAVCRFAFHHFPRPEQILAEIRRVLRPGGRLVLVDMIASEDAAQADYHNEIERLCDPSHARAIPATEFERMFTANGFEPIYKQTVKSSYNLEDWIAHGAPSADRVARIHTMMEDSLETDRSGLYVRRTDGRLHFSHTGACYVVRKRV